MKRSRCSKPMASIIDYFSKPGQNRNDDEKGLAAVTAIIKKGEAAAKQETDDNSAQANACGPSNLDKMAAGDVSPPLKSKDPEKDEIVWEVSPPVKLLKKQKKLSGQFDCPDSLLPCSGASKLQRCSSLTNHELDSWPGVSPSPGVAPGSEERRQSGKKSFSRTNPRKSAGRQKAILDILQKVERASQAENSVLKEKGFSDNSVSESETAGSGSNSIIAVNLSDAFECASSALFEKAEIVNHSQVQEEDKNIGTKSIVVEDMPAHIAELLDGTDLDAFFEPPKHSFDSNSARECTQLDESLTNCLNDCHSQMTQLPERKSNNGGVQSSENERAKESEIEVERKYLGQFHEVASENVSGQCSGSHIHFHSGHVEPLKDCEFSNLLRGASDGNVQSFQKPNEKFPKRKGLFALEDDENEDDFPELQHFTVVAIEDAANAHNKLLALKSNICEEAFKAILKDEWVYTPVEVGHKVGIVGDFDRQLTCIISAESNFVILHPDSLVSGSRVGASFTCPRRSVLDERYQYSGFAGFAALLGTMLHELFQVAIKRAGIGEKELCEEARSIVGSNVDVLFSIGEIEESVFSQLAERVPKILKFVKEFRKSHPPAAPNLESAGNSSSKKHVCITEVPDIEECVWSPRYGLKGMIDCSVRVKVRDSHSARVNTIMMPLELKTGKSTTGQTFLEHKAQVMLYTLLMSDRYNKKIRSGMLHYLHTGSTQGVDVVRRELVGIIMRRNEHANSMVTAVKFGELPPMIQSSRVCGNCSQLDTCTILHKAFEGGNGESSGMADIFNSNTEHLSESHLSFLRHWSFLIDLEAAETEKSWREIWSVDSRAQELKGRCISELIVDSEDVKQNSQENESGVYLYKFHRTASVLQRRNRDKRAVNKENCSRLSLPSNSFAERAIQKRKADVSFSKQSLLNLSFAEKDRVVISSESGHYGVIAGAVVQEITENYVKVVCSRRLAIGGDRQVSSRERVLRELWRIDKYEIGGMFGMLRGNLMSLFTAQSAAENGKGMASSQENLVVRETRVERLRSLVVDLAAPRTKECSYSCSFLKRLLLENELNDDQRQAVKRVLEAEDYALILGTPGSGKTTTIVHVVMALVAQKKSVLLAAHTNSAVDNILVKLKKKGVDFLRIGRSDAVNQNVLENTLSRGDGGVWFDSVSAMQSRIEYTLVFGVTCYGVNNSVFERKQFDYCIVDEASQIAVPAVLGAIMRADKFVLVGDHNQLPPLVKSEEARKAGMGVSLFQTLTAAHPEFVTMLSTQYRMCSDIMALSNHLVYEGKLRCGDNSLAHLKGVLKNPMAVQKGYPDLPSWLQAALDPENRVLFLNTDGLVARGFRGGEIRHDSIESGIVLTISKLLMAAEFAGDIGVISPYVDQVKKMRRMAKMAADPDFAAGLEIDTIDRFQGRDKGCVLVSFVVTLNGDGSSSGSYGRHVADLQRLNVCLTRAKSKLILVGSKSALSSADATKRLVDFVDLKGWTKNLPDEAALSCGQILGVTLSDSRNI